MLEYTLKPMSFALKRRRQATPNRDAILEIGDSSATI
jgi:hypothetical protein